MKKILLVAIASLAMAGGSFGRAGLKPSESEVRASTEAAQNVPKATPQKDDSAAGKRLTIEVSGGDKNVAVENASVYLKFVEEKKLAKDRKYELNVKTNREGVAHIPEPPLGRVLIQIVAQGWKTYGKYYELSDPGEVIKIHLERPPKWY